MTQNEKSNQIVRKIASLLNVTLNESQISTSHRLKIPQNPDPRIHHLIDQHASHCMGKMSESDFGFDRVRKFAFENSESAPIERNCRFDHFSAKHFRFEDSAPEPIQRNVFATPFRPYKGKEADQ